MREITVRYSGECCKCDVTIPEGAKAVYERRVGIFCPECAPTDPEEIRTYRQEAADRKADRYDEWAEKREAKATAQLSSHPEIRHDWAFITQPGRIPFRDRMNQSDAKAFESLKIADGMRTKAQSLRTVRVAGDAERKREARREKIRPLLSKGLRVDSPLWGTGTITRINKKTVTMIRESTGNSVNEGIEWLILNRA